MIRNLIPINPKLAMAAIGEHAYQQFGGWLISPRSRDLSPLHLAPVWAADNDCYSAWDEPAFLKLLAKIQGVPNCLFVNAPDVVQNHQVTLALYQHWQPIISGYNLPVGFVLQNGVTLADVPFATASAIFIGGSTEFKFSDTVREIVREARRLGKWVHNGRVNSRRRITYSLSIGCNSFDGTSYLYSCNIQSSLPAQTVLQKGLWS